MHIVLANHDFCWRSSLLECLRDGNIAHTQCDTQCDLVIGNVDFVIASQYTVYDCQVIIAPPQMSPHRLSALNRTASVIPCPDHVVLLAIFTPATHEQSKSGALSPERLQWMTWSADPIPFALACQLYYACPTLGHFERVEGVGVKGVGVEGVDAGIVGAWQTVREFLREDHYMLE